jgi:hypothetical protein
LDSCRPYGRSLNERIVKTLTVDRAHSLAEFYEEGDVRYALRACAYHLERMAFYYAENAQQFESFKHSPRAISGNTDDPRVYIEIDAFLSSAPRFYEQLRRLLWKHFGTSNPRPRSFETLLESHLKVSEDYWLILNGSWRDHGATLKKYRDRMSHYDPLNAGVLTVWLEPKDGRWRMTARLPNNPDTKSRDRFEVDRGPDALSYGRGQYLVEKSERS